MGQYWAHHDSQLKDEGIVSVHDLLYPVLIDEC